VPRSGLILRTGNAGALAILVDGKPAPAIGAVGTLRRNVMLEPEALLAGTAVKG
jgi:cytoskeleton protein RodZ